MPTYDLAWFLQTPFGQRWTVLDQAVYDMALAVAESELASVKCFCPQLYETALQIRIWLLLPNLIPATGPTPSAPAGSTAPTHVAYVIADRVDGAAERRYELVEAPELQVASTPSGILDRIVARCKAPVGIGARLVRSVSSGGGCGRAPFPLLDNGALHAMGLDVPFVIDMIGDKADG